jgi:hypothetical protein
MKEDDDERSSFTEEQVIAILREHEAGAKTADVCRKRREQRDVLQVESDLWRHGRVAGAYALRHTFGSMAGDLGFGVDSGSMRSSAPWSTSRWMGRWAPGVHFDFRAQVVHAEVR